MRDQKWFRCWIELDIFSIKFTGLIVRRRGLRWGREIVMISVDILYHLSKETNCITYMMFPYAFALSNALTRSKFERMLFIYASLMEPHRWFSIKFQCCSYFVIKLWTGYYDICPNLIYILCGNKLISYAGAVNKITKKIRRRLDFKFVRTINVKNFIFRLNIS